jgi:hypothetical protein
MEINKLKLRFKLWKYDTQKCYKERKKVVPKWILNARTGEITVGIANWDKKPSKEDLERAIDIFKRSLLLFQRIEQSRSAAYHEGFSVATELGEGYVDYTGSRPKNCDD